MAFTTPTCLYYYTLMPFGLKNAGTTYQRLVNKIFKEKLGDTLEFYIDDIVVKEASLARLYDYLGAGTKQQAGEKP